MQQPRVAREAPGHALEKAGAEGMREREPEQHGGNELEIGHGTFAIETVAVIIGRQAGQLLNDGGRTHRAALAGSCATRYDGRTQSGSKNRKYAMADINIVQEHKLTPKKARDAAQKVADKIADEYGLECEWQGDVLHFERSGVQGSLTLEKKKVEMVIKLGFLMSAFGPTIEAKVAENMKKVFGAA